MGQKSKHLVIDEVEWEQKPGNGWLLRQVFDLLLRDPSLPAVRTGADLTATNTSPTLKPETVADEEGGEP